jgi:hypothetical protein
MNSVIDTDHSLKRLRQTEQKTRMERKKHTPSLDVSNRLRTDNLVDKKENGRIILKWISKM